jgi:hypothetical protein
MYSCCIPLLSWFPTIAVLCEDQLRLTIIALSVICLFLIFLKVGTSGSPPIFSGIAFARISQSRGYNHGRNGYCGSVGRVNYCWPSLASTVNLGFESRRNPLPYFCSLQDLCFEMGGPLRREEGSDYYWPLPFYWSYWLTAKFLLVFASTVILRSESHGTQDHILLYDGSGSLENSLSLGIGVRVTLRPLSPILEQILKYVNAFRWVSLKVFELVI